MKKIKFRGKALLIFMAFFSCKTNNITTNKAPRFHNEDIYSDDREKEFSSSESNTNDLWNSFNKKRNIRLERNSKYQVTDIYFLSPSEQVENRVINIFDSNPYSEKYAQYLTGIESDLFTFPDISIQDFIDTNNVDKYLGFSSTDKVNKGYTTHYTYLNDKNVLLAHNLYLISEYNTIGINSSIKIYDTLGSMVYFLEEQEVNCNSAVITDDGRFLCISFGLDGENKTLLNNGYRIIDIQKGSVIFEKVINAGIPNLTPLTVDNRVYLLFNKKRNVECFITFDFINNRELYFEYPMENGEVLKEINKDGIIISLPNGRLVEKNIKIDFKQLAIQ